MTSTLLPNAKQTFSGPNGTPLSGGSVYFYIPGTTTPKDTYQDAAQTILNTNPVVLDANGQAVIWGAGSYRQVVYDVYGNLVWDQITQDLSGGLLGNITDNTYIAANGDFVPGTTAQLTLSSAPGSIANTWTFFDGVFQADDQATVDGLTLTFGSPIPVGVEEVTVKVGNSVALGIPGSGTVTDAMIAAGTKLMTRLTKLVYATDFGARGNWNGTTGADDTTAIQNALNSFGALGGILHLANLRYLVNSLTVPQNVSIVGDLPSPSQASVAAAENYYAVGAQLCLTPGSTITMQRGSGIFNCMVIRQGLPLPVTSDAGATAAIAAFSGTGLTVVDSDVTIRDVIILGHTQCVDATWTPASGFGRLRMQNVLMDGTNGMTLGGAEDISRFIDCHFWPFLTAEVSGVSNINLTRAGIAYNFTATDDWGMCRGCFSYGALIGFQLSDVSAIDLLQCGVDSSGVQANDIGVNVIGTSTFSKIVDMTINSVNTGIELNSTATNFPELVIDGAQINIREVGINVDAGRLLANNLRFHSGGSFAIQFGAGTLSSSIDNVHFENVGGYTNFSSSAVSELVQIGTITTGPNSPAITTLPPFAQRNILAQFADPRPAAVGVGAGIDLSGQYSWGQGTFWRIQSSLLDATLGAESSNLNFITYADGVFVQRLTLQNDGMILPAVDAAQNLGSTSLRMNTVYSANGVVTTSDRNSKRDIQDVPDFLLDMIDELPARMFKLEKQDQWSVGYIAQDVQEWLESHGHDPADFSFWINDQLDDGSFRQGLRYDQMAVLEAAASKRRAARSVRGIQ